MNDEEAEALGRRLLAAGCPWQAGMVIQRESRHLGTVRRRLWGDDCDGDWFADPDGSRCVGDPARSDFWADLRDAATRGAVLEALREERMDRRIHLVYTQDQYSRPVWTATSYRARGAETEAEALVLAWGAA